MVLAWEKNAFICTELSNINGHIIVNSTTRLVWELNTVCLSFVIVFGFFFFSVGKAYDNKYVITSIESDFTLNVKVYVTNSYERRKKKIEI